MNDDYGNWNGSMWDPRVWQARPNTTVARVTFTVDVPLAEPISTNNVVLSAMQKVAKSVVDNGNDTFKAMNSGGWHAEIQTGMF